MRCATCSPSLSLPSHERAIGLRGQIWEKNWRRKREEEGGVKVCAGGAGGTGRHAV